MMSLRKIKVFSALGMSEFTTLSSRARERVFSKGETIFKEGESSRWVWLVKTGWVHLVRRDAHGSPVILFTMTPHEILCGVSAFDQEPYAADGVAATECILVQIPSRFFVECLNRNSKFCRDILSVCSGRIRKMAQKLGGANDPVASRAARLLLASMKDFGREIPFTHREIAQMIGARIETSIRTFRVLREKRLLSIRRSCIEIHRPTALTQELHRWLRVG